jgi:hypothetical protein
VKVEGLAYLCGQPISTFWNLGPHNSMIEGLKYQHLYEWDRCGAALHRPLYVTFFLCQVGLSYFSCRRFYEGAQSQAHWVNFSPGIRLTELLSNITWW